MVTWRTNHMSDMSVAWRLGSVRAWARATYQYHVNGTNTVGRSVGRSVDARGPVDHDSVGLAQARPNYHDRSSNQDSRSVP